MALFCSQETIALEMIVTCHQPHFLPWIPYFNKLAHSDLFIVLDDVDYRKNYFQNRTLIIDNAKRTYWLTVPVKRLKLGTPISQVHLSNSCSTLRISINRLREVYRAHCNNEFLQSVLAILEKPPSRLIDINMALIDLVLKELCFEKLDIIPISKIVGKKPRDERVLSALKEVGATRVIVGMGGMATAHDLPRWEKAGLELDFQRRQNMPDDCSLMMGNGISILHDIVTAGRDKVAKIVKQFWLPGRS